MEVSRTISSPVAPVSRGSAVCPSRQLRQQSPVSTQAAIVLPEWYEKAEIGGDLPEDYSDYYPPPNRQRRAGVLVHPTSFPGDYGIGELGAESFAAVDWMASAGLQVWQLLPIGPPDSFQSPYSGTDANCGNPLMISIDSLIEDGLLDKSDTPAKVPVGAIDFATVTAVKTPLIKKAANRLLKDGKFEKLRGEMATWRKINPWIESSAIFDVAAHQEGLNDKAWWEWPEALRYRKPEAIKEFQDKHGPLLEEFIATQFIFERQWVALKAYANSKDIKIVGDMPIYIGAHSADVWSNPGLFDLDTTGAPAEVSGVPPDAFSDDGQKWGSPLFKWKDHKAEGYKWWIQRLQRALALYDETRIDHFRGFAGYWAVKAEEPTAMKGVWRKGPGKDLFDVLKEACWPGVEYPPIIAEDLGVITGDVIDLRDYIAAPGMVVLQFAWGGGGTNPHLPSNHPVNSFCYPGTHDNETTVGWFKGSASEDDKRVLKEYLNSDLTDVAWDFIRAAYESVSYTSVLAIQDIMRLDNSARMNSPGSTKGNWSWRMGDSTVWKSLEKEAAELSHLAGVCNRNLKKPKE